MTDHRARLTALVDRQTAVHNDDTATEEDRIRVYEDIRQAQAARRKDEGGKA